MKIKCIHGFFKIWPDSSSEVSRFINNYGLILTTRDWYFTFPPLASAKNYSLVGKTYVTFPATETFEGEPGEVMRKNKIVYDFSKGVTIPIASVLSKLQLENCGEYFLSSGLIIPGALTDDGKRVTDYTAHWDSSVNIFRYSEVAFV